MICFKFSTPISRARLDTHRTQQREPLSRHIFDAVAYLRRLMNASVNVPHTLVVIKSTNRT